MSFLSIQHISEFFKKEATNNPDIMKILPNMTLYRQKSQMLSTKVLKENYKSHITKILENTLFSISADEVTDIIGIHYLFIFGIFPV